MNEYVGRVLEELETRYVHEPEFLQAVREILATLSPVVDMHPEWESQALLERLTEPERVIMFRVPWQDDTGHARVNRAWRVKFNSALGPYKGGMRFHPSVNLSILKFLALEQTLKNSLTLLPIGGGKGGSDFDPRGKSDSEVMRFCQSLVTELYRHIGKDMDVPAGDIGVGAREVAYMYGQYKRLTGLYEGVFTGKGLTFGGSLIRKEATGYGLCYLMEAMLKSKGLSLQGQRVVVSGSGNVSIYTAEKAMQLGAKVVAMSDSSGFVVNENGINLDIIKDIKEVKRERIAEYAQRVPGARYQEGSAGIWHVPCSIALPCATQNELDEASAQALIDNGVLAVGEGANMPTTLEATKLFQQNGVLFAPGKAANAGGVSVSALEMTQNSMRLSWTREEVDAKLQQIMGMIFNNISAAARKYATPDDYVAGANIAGFLRVAEAMVAQGLV